MLLNATLYPKNLDALSLSKSQRKKIIFLHGMGGTGALWRPVAASLEDSYDLLCPDQRGHGKSFVSADETDFSPLTFAQDVFETASHMSFTPSWVIGHSMGARTACGYAKLFPQATLGLILVDMSLSSGAGGGIGNLLASFLHKLPSTFTSRAEARTYLLEHCPDPSIAQYLVAVSTLNAQTGQITFPFDQNALLKTIAESTKHMSRPWVLDFAETGKPIFILRGETSKIFTRAEYDKECEAFRQFTNVQLIEFAGTGHGLPFEKRLEFVQLIKNNIQN